ncbi:unnamed protein product, partial [Symbiodinium necroappetens]
AMGKRPVWQIQTCQYCGKQGHNTRSCPTLALKLLKKLQVKHSVTAMSKAVMDGCEPLTVQGMERRRGSRKAAQRLEHRRVRNVHKGTRGVSTARKKSAIQQKRRWAEKRRTAKRQTKCDAKVKLAECRETNRQAWKKFQQMQLVRQTLRSYRQFACPQCEANCICRQVLKRKSDMAAKEALRKELKKLSLPEHTVYFRGSRCCRLFSCLRFTILPVKKTHWPLAQVVGFVEEFMDMAKPNMQELCRRDGTCLKLFKRAGSNFHVALWGLVQRPTNHEALEQILPTVKGDREMASVLLTDGAKVYNKLAKAYGLQHKFVVHSKSEWSKTVSAGSHGRLRVNTGLIDERWKCIKGYVPVSLSGGSRDDSETTFSPHLFNYLYSWWLRTQVPAAEERIKLIGRALLRAGAMHRAGIVAAEAAESDGVTSSDHALALSTSAEHMSEDNLVDFSDRSEESMEAAPVNVVASTSAGRDRSDQSMEAAPVNVVASTGERQPPLSATLTAAAGRRRRAFKWGCHIHEKEILKNGTALRRALCPHIFRSGRNQGQLWLLCSDWWRERRCWHKEPFDMSRFKELPTWQQDCLDAYTRMRKP